MRGGLPGDGVHAHGRGLRMLKVKVTLFGTLREKAGQAELDVELEDEACVKDAIAAIGLEDRVDIWVLVNGTRTGRDTRLSNGAELTFFQPVGGG